MLAVLLDIIASNGDKYTIKHVRWPQRQWQHKYCQYPCRCPVHLVQFQAFHIDEEIVENDKERGMSPEPMFRQVDLFSSVPYKKMLALA